MIAPTHWYVEIHTLKSSVEIGNHIVWHLVERLRLGNAIIVCTRPDDLIGAFAKRWKKIIRIVERERAATLRPEIREQTARILKLLKNTRFVARTPSAAIGPTVWMAAPEALGHIPRSCNTVYVIAPVSQAILDDWANGSQPGGALLIYHELPGT